MEIKIKTKGANTMFDAEVKALRESLLAAIEAEKLDSIRELTFAIERLKTIERLNGKD